MSNNPRTTPSRNVGIGVMNLRASSELATTTRFQHNNFIMGNCRIYLKNNENNKNMSLDESKYQLRWDQVLRLDVICTDDSMPHCPICLEQNFTCPHITKCGHIFCLPCFFKYLYYPNSCDIQCKRCPVCSVLVFKEDLRTTRFQIVESINEIKSISLCLVERRHDLACIELSRELKDSISHYSPKEKISSSLLDETSFGLQFVKFATFKRPDILWKEDVFTLNMLFDVQLETRDFNDAIAAIESITFLEERIERFIQEKNNNIARVKTNNIHQNNYNVDYAIKDFVDIVKSSLMFSSSYESSTPILIEKNKANEEQKFYTFYQSVDGQLCFLDPLQFRCIKYEHKCSSELPPLLFDVKVMGSKTYLLNSSIRDRYKFLNYLPLNTPITFVEIDIDQIVSQATRDQFRELFEQRNKYRRSKQERSEKQEKSYLENLQLKEKKKMNQIISIHRSEDLTMDYEFSFPALSHSPTTSADSSKSRLNTHETSLDTNSQSPQFEMNTRSWPESPPSYSDILKYDSKSHRSDKAFHTNSFNTSPSTSISNLNSQEDYSISYPSLKCSNTLLLDDEKDPETTDHT